MRILVYIDGQVKFDGKAANKKRVEEILPLVRQARRDLNPQQPLLESGALPN